MSTIEKEDWIHIDQYWERVGYLEDQVKDLKIEVQGAESDEAYILAQIYKALESASRHNEWRSYSNLMRIIQGHRQEVRDRAQQIIKSEA